MNPPVGSYILLVRCERVRCVGGDGLLCSSRRAVSFSGLRYSVALSMMAPVLRSNWMYLPKVGCASAVAVVGFVSTMMLGVRCWKLSAFREVGIKGGGKLGVSTDKGMEGRGKSIISCKLKCMYMHE